MMLSAKRCRGAAAAAESTKMRFISVRKEQMVVIKLPGMERHGGDADTGVARPS